MPVVLEGIGIGRLRRRTSTAMVAALLERATATTVRSAAAAATVTRLVGRPPAVAADPAFDYIATRIACDRMSARERQALDELALRSPAARLICINARPATRRRAAVAAALSRLARIMVEFARIHPVRYVFFPLETETNTGRDLDAAEELARHLPADVDFRVWPDRPSVDGTLALLRGADAAVTMRFHAAVFALSQGVPTVGIDFYHAGVPGKVTDLFDELREGACVFDIANIDPDRVVRLLVELTAAHRGDFAKRAD